MLTAQQYFVLVSTLYVYCRITVKRNCDRIRMNFTCFLHLKCLSFNNVDFKLTLIKNKDREQVLQALQAVSRYCWWKLSLDVLFSVNTPSSRDCL